MSDKFNKLFKESIKVKENCIQQGFKSLKIMGDEICESIKKGNKLMLCGNGGSAADAQHLAAEMLIRLTPSKNREGIPAICLAQDTSTITACGNDYGYDFLFQRLVETLGTSNDCLIALSTSGNSKNILRVLQAAKKKNIKTFGFLGSEGGKAINYCDEFFLVPSYETGRIQEAHITAGHALMEYIEGKLLDSEYIKIKDEEIN